MKGVLSRVMSTGDSSFGAAETVSHEGLYDACRAYGLLLHASGVTGREEHDKVSQEVSYTLCRNYFISLSANL